jgi:cellobiose-specific phosphotransferase system component IIA
MINKKHLQTLRKGLHDYALVRRDVIKYAGDALHHSKRAVFDMQKGDVKEAKKKLAEAEDLFKKLHKTHKKDTQILQEGSYKAAVEEYVEANLSQLKQKSFWQACVMFPENCTDMLFVQQQIVTQKPCMHANQWQMKSLENSLNFTSRVIYAPNLTRPSSQHKNWRLWCMR